MVGDIKSKYCIYCDKMKARKAFRGDKCYACNAKFRVLIDAHVPVVECSLCGIAKPQSQFYVRRAGRCIECQASYIRTKKESETDLSGEEPAFNPTFQNVLSKKW